MPYYIYIYTLLLMLDEMMRYVTVGAPGGAWNRRRRRLQQFNAGLLASNDDRN